MPLILANGDPGGSAGHGLTVEGFVMRSGWAGLGSGSFAVLGVRVRRLVIRGNRFEEGFDVPLDLRETSARIERNHIAGTGLCDICLAGPGDFKVTGNRLVEGALEGILTTPAIDFESAPGVDRHPAGHRSAHGRDHEQRGPRPPASPVRRGDSHRRGRPRRAGRPRHEPRHDP